MRKKSGYVNGSGCAVLSPCAYTSLRSSWQLCAFVGVNLLLNAIVIVPHCLALLVCVWHFYCCTGIQCALSHTLSVCMVVYLCVVTGLWRSSSGGQTQIYAGVRRVSEFLPVFADARGQSEGAFRCVWLLLTTSMSPTQHSTQYVGCRADIKNLRN